MIKTATSSATQETGIEPAGYAKDTQAQVRQSATKESVVKQSSAVKEQGVVVAPYPSEPVNAPAYQDILNDLQEKRKLLHDWQNELNIRLKDPAKANEVVNYLTGLQYLKNTIADLTSQLGIMSVAANGYSFHDNQSVLQSASVRRKDTEALRDIKDTGLVNKGIK